MRCIVWPSVRSFVRSLGCYYKNNPMQARVPTVPLQVKDARDERGRRRWALENIYSDVSALPGSVGMSKRLACVVPCTFNSCYSVKGLVAPFVNNSFLIHNRNENTKFLRNIMKNLRI